MIRLNTNRRMIAANRPMKAKALTRGSPVIAVLRLIGEDARANPPIAHFVKDFEPGRTVDSMSTIRRSRKKIRFLEESYSVVRRIVAGKSPNFSLICHSYDCPIPAGALTTAAPDLGREFTNGWGNAMREWPQRRQCRRHCADVPDVAAARSCQLPCPPYSPLK